MERGGASPARIQALYTIAAATLAAIVPLIFLAGFWMRSEINKSQRDTEAFLTVQASSLSSRLDAQVREQLSALVALAALPSLDASSSDTFGNDADRVRAAMPMWSTIGLVDVATGQHVFSRGREWSVENERGLLEEVQRTRLPRVETRLSDITGNDRVLLYAPVLRGETVRAVLVVATDVPELRDIANATRGALLMTVVDRHNRILGRSRQADELVGRLASDEFIQKTQGQASGLFEGTSLMRESLVAAYDRSPLTGWVSFVGKDRTQLDAAGQRSLWATVAAGALSLLLFAILGVFLFHTVMERRVSNERLAASQALGDLDARLLATTQEALDEQRKAASEREVLLREIYHRVKNNLQIVQSLLRLGSRELKPDQREPFESAVRRIGAMARVHTLLYNSPDLASIDFKDYLDELLRELSEGFSAEERSIEHVLNAHSLRLPLDTAVPLAFIAVEILTNAFRHAFPEGRPGKINVEARRTGLVGTLRIEDNGVGLSADEKSKRRLGLTIVGKLVQQIGGTLEEPAPGSSVFTITFPLAAEDEAAMAVERALGRHRDALAAS
jgi:two-component sensor histidine kinase